MMRKTPVKPPTRTAYNSFREDYLHDPSVAKFLEVFEAEQDLAFSKNKHMIPNLGPEDKVSEADLSSKKLNKAAFALSQPAQDQALQMMSGDSSYWKNRYLTASGLYYHWSGWSAVLKNALKGTKFEKEDENLFSLM